MKNGNLYQVGGLFAILLGIAKIISPILYILMPAGLRAEVPAKTFLPAFAAQPDLLLAFFWTEALVGIFGLAIVPAINSMLKGENEGWRSFGGNLAIIGYGVSSVGYMLSISRLPAIAKLFVSDPSAQAVLSATWKASINLLPIRITRQHERRSRYKLYHSPKPSEQGRFQKFFWKLLKGDMATGREI